MAKCLVIGANGFIGSHLVDELVLRGHVVTAFDRFSVSRPAYSSTSVVQIAGDFMNRSDVTAAVAHQEYVFHFLSTTTPATAENDPTLDVRTNITSSIGLFEACVDAGVRKVFFASTGGAIYGDQPGAELTENSVANPVSPYAIGKLAIEGYLRYFETKHGLASVSFRISNPYGPRQRANKRQGVIPIFLHRIVEELPLTVFGDGSMVRDYVYIGDVVRMIAKSVEDPKASGVYNIGSGEGTSLNQLLDVLRDVTGRVLTIDSRETPSTYLKHVVLNTTKFRSQFGYSEFVSLHEGITAMWQQIEVDPR
ncbi:UDP-glucose 4-epimerase [Clavibacter michiganensis]|nr:NAD-dependent epimerase/dehydratase family protein [Clavibacter michiganensis]PPF60985.1 UDP-glucose 4-epimerase [Clavibacter michiganensis]